MYLIYEEFRSDLKYLYCCRCVSSVDGYQTVLAAVLEVERDNAHTGVDIQAAKLTAQKLTENGIKGDRLGLTDKVGQSSFFKNMFFPPGETQYSSASKEDSEPEENEDKGDKEVDEEKEKLQEDKKESAPPPPPVKVSPGNFSDLEELLFCRSPNQIKVETGDHRPPQINNKV